MDIKDRLQFLKGASKAIAQGSPSVDREQGAYFIYTLATILSEIITDDGEIKGTADGRVKALCWPDGDHS